MISLPTYVETTELLAEFWGVIFRKYGWMHSVFRSDNLDSTAVSVGETRNIGLPVLLGTEFAIDLLFVSFNNFPRPQPPTDTLICGVVFVGSC